MVSDILYFGNRKSTSTQPLLPLCYSALVLCLTKHSMSTNCLKSQQSRKSPQKYFENARATQEMAYAS